MHDTVGILRRWRQREADSGRRAGGGMSDGAGRGRRGRKVRREGLKKGENRWMDTDTPAQGRPDIMVLCGDLIGREQHWGGPRRRSGSVSHLLDYRVKRARRRAWITFDALYWQQRGEESVSNPRRSRSRLKCTMCREFLRREYKETRRRRRL